MEFAMESTLNATKSVFDNITLFEPINIKIAKQLYNSNYPTEEDRKLLTSYFSKYDSTSDNIPVLYSRGKSRYGRVYPNCGLTFIRRELRNTLIRDWMYDLDIKKCHPTLIKLSVEDEVAIPKLDFYIKNSDKVIQRIMDFYDCDKYTAKQSINIICFGGSFETWKNEYEIIGDCNEYFTVLKNEIITVANFLKEKNPKLYQFARDKKEAKNSKNYLGSFLAYYLQEQELRIIGHVFEFLKEKVIAEPFVCAYEYDGIKILKGDVDIYGGIEKLIKDINMLVPVEFVNKSMDEFYDVSNVAIDDKPYIIDTKEMKTKKKMEIKQDKINDLLNDDNNVIIEYNDDKQAGIIMYEQFKDRIVYSNGCFFITKNNIWFPIDKKKFSEVCDFINFNTKLKIYQKNASDEPKLYSSKASAVKGMNEFIRSQLVGYEDIKFVQRLAESNIDHLFFNDKIYSFKDKKYYKFDELKNVISSIKLSYDAPSDIDFSKEEAEITERILQPLFKNQEHINYFLYCIQQCLRGNPSFKHWFLLIGVRNSGKSFLGYFLQCLFENYFCIANSANLFLKGENSDSERSFQWMAKLEYARICFLSEMKVDKKIDSSIVKPIVGSDSIEVRQVYQEARKIRPQGKLFLLSNNDLKADNNDVFENMITFQFNNKFVDNVTIDQEEINKGGYFKFVCKDESISNLLETNKMKQAFMNLILCADKTSKPKDMVEEEVLDESNSDKYLFDKYFEVTLNGDDRVSNSELKCKLNMDPRKIKGKLREWGWRDEINGKKLNYKNKGDSYYLGIKKIADCTEDDIEECVL